jgi:hypothetical protein
MSGAPTVALLLLVKVEGGRLAVLLIEELGDFVKP